MTGHSAAQSYGSPAIVLHWALAAAVFLALPLGFLAAHASDSRQAASFLRIHIPLGILILLLTVARALWRYRHAPPPPLSGESRWLIALARVSHTVLYVVPIALSVSGLALLALSGAAPIVFARVRGTLPNFTQFPPMALHAAAASALIGLLGLHLAAVVYHQVYRRDRLLARMGIGSTAGRP